MCVAGKKQMGWCDYGHGPCVVKRLNIGGGAGLYLCRRHWAAEMRWRKERNKSLPPGSRFRILKW